MFVIICVIGVPLYAIRVYKMTLFHSKASLPKFDQQADAKFRGGQIVQHLFGVRVGQFFDGLGLKENFIPDNEVRTQTN